MSTAATIDPAEQQAEGEQQKKIGKSTKVPVSDRLNPIRSFERQKSYTRKDGKKVEISSEVQNRHKRDYFIGKRKPIQQAD